MTTTELRACLEQEQWLTSGWTGGSGETIHRLVTKEEYIFGPSEDRHIASLCQ